MQLHVRALLSLPLVAVFVLAGCTKNEAPVVEPAEVGPDNAHFVAVAGHSPPFARMPYEKFSRTEAVAIAQQEWRLFGQRVDDNPPHTDANANPEASDRLQRFPGLWQRIGEYLVARTGCGSPRGGLDGHARRGRTGDRRQPRGLLRVVGSVHQLRHADVPVRAFPIRPRIPSTST